jgi:uncharacterized membrane protein YkoI
VPADVIYNQIQGRSGGQIIRATLCPQGGKFIYKFVIMSAKGDVKKLTVDARTGR